MLVTSNFSFSHNVLHSYIYSMRQNAVMCGNGLRRETYDLRCGQGGGLIHSQTMTPFDTPGKQAFRKHCGKRRNCS